MGWQTLEMCQIYIYPRNVILNGPASSSPTRCDEKKRSRQGFDQAGLYSTANETGAKLTAKATESRWFIYSEILLQFTMPHPCPDIKY